MHGDGDRECNEESAHLCLRHTGLLATARGAAWGGPRETWHQGSKRSRKESTKGVKPSLTLETFHSYGCPAGKQAGLRSASPPVKDQGQTG